MSFTMIEKVTDWPLLLEACGDVSAIAIDTEFMRTSTYYPKVGLVQIFNGTTCFLIDPVALPDIEPLKALLVRDDLTKVLHACSEDLEVFQHALGALPVPIFDTQIASAALGVGFSMSYQNTVSHFLGIDLPKDQTRSDWMARPLSAEQLDYAALDVVHLLEVYQEQMKLLEGTPKLDWVIQESREMGVDIPTMVEPGEWYTKIKGLSQFSRKELYLLKKLFEWREKMAREEDSPRNHIVDQKALITVVKEGLATRSDLQHVTELSHRQLRKYGDDILFIISASREVSEDDCPDAVPGHDRPIDNKKLKLLKKVAEEEAARLNVAPELLIRRRFLEKLIRSGERDGDYRLPEEFKGWRESVIGQPLLAALADS